MAGHGHSPRPSRIPTPSLSAFHKSGVKKKTSSDADKGWSAGNLPNQVKKGESKKSSLDLHQERIRARELERKDSNDIAEETEDALQQDAAFLEMTSLHLRLSEWQEMLDIEKRKTGYDPPKFPASTKQDLIVGGDTMTDEELLRKLQHKPGVAKASFDRFDGGESSERPVNAATPFMPTFGPPAMELYTALRKQVENATFLVNQKREPRMCDMFSLPKLCQLRKLFMRKAREKYRQDLEAKYKPSEVDDLMESGRDEAEQVGLDINEFKRLMMYDLEFGPQREHYIHSLFVKIDDNSDLQVDWQEICTYMVEEMKQKEAAYKEFLEFKPQLPAQTAEHPHTEGMVRILGPRINEFLCLSGDGRLSFWSIAGRKLELVKTVEPFSSLPPPRAGPHMRYREPVVESPLRKPIIWAIDFQYLPTMDKFVILSSDRAVSFYDGATMELDGHLVGLPVAGTRMQAHLRLGTPICTIVIGDQTGCVGVLLIPHLGEALSKWRVPKKLGGRPERIAIHTAIENKDIRFSRWKFHNDWSLDVRYIRRTERIVSISTDEEASVVIMKSEKLTDPDIANALLDVEHLKTSSTAAMPLDHPIAQNHTIFKVNKGVMSIDFIVRKDYSMATGGIDRIIRLWDPRMSKAPFSTLTGHQSAVTQLKFQEEENHLLSASSDMTIKIWDLSDYRCINTMLMSEHGVPMDFNFICYHDYDRCLAVSGGREFGVIHLMDKRRSPLPATSHMSPVNRIIFSEKFGKVFSADDDSMVKVWDYETGSKYAEITNAHNQMPVTDLLLDGPQGRLITAGRDGDIKVWNYHNGHCLAVLKRHNYFAKENQPFRHVNGLALATLPTMAWVVSVGWDQHISIHPDLNESKAFTRHPYPLMKDDSAKKGHSDEVCSVAYSAKSDMIVTGGYDGTVCVWNTGAGQLIKKHNTTSALGLEGDNDRVFPYGSLAVTTVKFLDSRFVTQGSQATSPHAAVVSCGAGGGVVFWHHIDGFWDSFTVPLEHGMVHRLAVTKDNKVLITASLCGYVALWDISKFGLRDLYEDGEDYFADPTLISEWQAHSVRVNSVELIETHALMLTASDDWCVRIWNYYGEFIGTFGQQDPWNLSDPNTFQTPRHPPGVTQVVYSNKDWTFRKRLGFVNKRQSSATSRRQSATMRSRPASRGRSPATQDASAVHSASESSDSDLPPGALSPAAQATLSHQATPSPSGMLSQPPGRPSPSHTMNALTEHFQAARQEKRRVPCKRQMSSMLPILRAQRNKELQQQMQDREKSAARARTRAMTRASITVYDDASAVDTTTDTAEETAEERGRRRRSAWAARKPPTRRRSRSRMSGAQSAEAPDPAATETAGNAPTQPARNARKPLPKIPSLAEAFGRVDYGGGIFGAPGPMHSYPGPRVRHHIAQQLLKKKPNPHNSVYSQLKLYELQDVNLPTDVRKSFLEDHDEFLDKKKKKTTTGVQLPPLKTGKRKKVTWKVD